MSKQQEEMNKRFDEKVAELKLQVPNTALGEYSCPVVDFGYTVLEGDNLFRIVDFGNIKSFIQSEIDLAVAEERKRIVGGIIQKTLDSWHEAQTLRMNIDGSTTPDVNLELMGKILLKKLSLITKEN